MASNDTTINDKQETGMTHFNHKSAKFQNFRPL
jgi:hypothetical protein